MLLVAAALALPASAAAAPGDIAGMSCISELPSSGCAALPQPGVLDAAGGIAIAPGGADVYVGAATGVAHFRRAADGSLTYQGCIDTISGGCPTAAPADGGSSLSLNSIDLAVSPDGKHVYATSWADALVWFTRDLDTGELTWGGCRDAATDAATNSRCGTATTFAGGNFPAGSMAFQQGIAITPDGQTIYIADQTEGLLQAQRNPTTGVPTPTACFNTTGSQATGCTALAADIPVAASGIDLASNSRDVYVRSGSPGGITHFTRSAGGATSFGSCVGASATASCGTPVNAPVFTYSGTIGVAGDLVFMSGGRFGPESGTVARFARLADGELSYESCATTEAAPGACTPLPAETLRGGIRRLLVTPDGSSIYLPQGGTERALTRLTGSLGFGSCISDTGIAACSPAPLPVPFAGGNAAMVLSPDGRQIYQASSETVNVYAIEQPSTGGPGGGGGPPVTPVDPIKRAKAPRIRSVKRLADGRYRIRVRVLQAGTLRVKLRGKLRAKARVRTLGRVATRRLRRAGRVTVVLRPPRAARERRVRARLVATLAAPGYLTARRARAVRLR